MRFVVQYWLKSDLIDTPTTELAFSNTTELRDWVKPRLDNNNLDNYDWTILLDRTDIGEGFFTIIHSQDNIDDLLARMELHPKYKQFVKNYAIQIRQLLNL